MASKTAESFSFETKEGEAEIVYGDMSVAAVQLPPHLRKRLDASKNRFKKTPLDERMALAEKKRQENLENVQMNCRKHIEAAEKAAKSRAINTEAFAEKCEN